MPEEDKINKFTLLGIATVAIVFVAFMLLQQLAGSPDATSAGPVPQVRQ